MTTLALEFSSNRRSVALGRPGGAVVEESETGGRVTNACALIDRVLRSSKTRREDIDVVAVGVGPGSYTGVRAAIAVAQGWQFARGVKILAISSVESIAKEAQHQNILGRINVMLDAQRGEFYLSTYLVSNETIQEISPLKILTQLELESLRTNGEVFVGPEATTIAFPRASAIIHLAASRENYLQGGDLRPIYLRETSFAKAQPKIIKS